MIKDLLRKSPYFIRKPLKSIYNNLPDNIKYGRSFTDLYNFLEESQFWSREKLEEYQLSELKKIINHGYNNVPYYKRIFEERGLTPNDIKDFSDLKKIPYLTKNIIRKNLKDLIATNYKEKERLYCTTGGSTGLPLEFCMNKNINIREDAFIASQWSRVGYDINKKNKMVVLMGHIPPKNYYEFLGNKLILSSFKLREDNFKDYVNLIDNFKPDFIHCYPSSIVTLSKYMNNHKIFIKNKNLKAILCVSENLYQGQREYIENTFNCRVYSFYGHSERCCLAGECEINNYYHIFPQYGYTELINEDNNENLKEDEIVEIVATGFNNYAMPFIRYKTEDMAVNTNGTCSCGRNYKLIKRIEGRKQEFFVNKFGDKITFTRSHFPLAVVKDKIMAYQYVQNKPGNVILNIETKYNLNEEEINNIKEIFLNMFSNIDIKINRSEKVIERTKAGKFKYLIQNVKI